MPYDLNPYYPVRGCYSKYFKRGCYADIDTFNTLLFDNTSTIEWDDGWNDFIKDLACRFVQLI